MGKSHIIALLAVILAGIYYIGTVMSFGNSAHDFYVNYLSSITPNQMQQQVIAWAYWFFLVQQIVIIGTFSVPVIAFVVVIVGATAYFKSRR